MIISTQLSETYERGLFCAAFRRLSSVAGNCPGWNAGLLLILSLAQAAFGDLRSQIVTLKREFYYINIDVDRLWNLL